MPDLIEPSDCDHAAGRTTGWAHSVGSGAVLDAGESWEGGECAACGSELTRRQGAPPWFISRPPDPERFVEREAADREINLVWAEGPDADGNQIVKVSPGSDAGPVGVGPDRVDASLALARQMHWIR